MRWEKDGGKSWKKDGGRQEQKSKGMNAERNEKKGGGVTLIIERI